MGDRGGDDPGRARRKLAQRAVAMRAQPPHDDVAVLQETVEEDPYQASIASSLAEETRPMG